MKITFKVEDDIGQATNTYELETTSLSSKDFQSKTAYKDLTNFCKAYAIIKGHKARDITVEIKEVE